MLIAVSHTFHFALSQNFRPRNDYQRNRKLFEKVLVNRYSIRIKGLLYFQTERRISPHRNVSLSEKCIITWGNCAKNFSFYSVRHILLLLFHLIWSFLNNLIEFLTRMLVSFWKIAYLQP